MHHAGKDPHFWDAVVHPHDSREATIRLVLPAQQDHRQNGNQKDVCHRHLCAFDENSEPGLREDQSKKQFDMSGSQGLNAFCLFKG